MVWLRKKMVTIRMTLLTLILPTPKVISLCYQCRARPGCTSVQSDQAIYTVYILLVDLLKVFILISLKNGKG